MLCDDCKKRPATVHITQITNNQKKDKHLCSQCSQVYGDLGFSYNPQVSVNDFLKSIFNSGFGEMPGRNEDACSGCGMTYSDFSRSGKFGCSACYSHFAPRVEPLLRRIHGVSMHTGKVPQRSGGALGLKQQMKKLRQTLERHVHQEEYEQAAAVRDQIRTLEKELEKELEKSGEKEGSV